MVPFSDKAHHMFVWGYNIWWWPSVAAINGERKSRSCHHWRIRTKGNQLVDLLQTCL